MSFQSRAKKICFNSNWLYDHDMSIEIFNHPPEQEHDYSVHFTIFVDCSPGMITGTMYLEDGERIGEEIIDRPIDRRFEIMYRNELSVQILPISKYINYVNFGINVPAEDMTPREIILSLRNLSDTLYRHHVATLRPDYQFPKEILTSGLRIGIVDEFNNTAELHDPMKKVTASTETDAMHLRLML